MVIENLGPPTCRCYWAPGSEGLKEIYWFNVDLSPEGLIDFQRGTKCRKCGQTWWVIGMNQDAEKKTIVLYKADGN